MAAESTMDRIARALGRLGEVTSAVQDTAVAVTHVANAHEVIGRAAAHAAQQVERIADAATSAAVGFVALGAAATKAADAVDRLAATAERMDPQRAASAEYTICHRPARWVGPSGELVCDRCIMPAELALGRDPAQPGQLCTICVRR